MDTTEFHELTAIIGSLGVSKATSIHTFDFSTLYTSIPHDLLKSRMINIISNAFRHKNRHTRYNLKVARNESYFTKDSKRKLARKFSLSYRYTDDLISFNNKRFKEFFSYIYPLKLTIHQ